jgi:hypothetical protein
VPARSLLLLLPVVLLACRPADETEPGVLSDTFDRASVATGVPADLIAGIAWSSSRLDGRGGLPGDDGGLTLMGLHRDGAEPSLDRAATLADLDTAEVAGDDEAAILAAAFLLAGEARDVEALTGEPVDTLEEWYPIVAWYSGAADPLVGDGFAEQVYDWMQLGVAAEAPSGEIVQIGPVAMPWRKTAVTGSRLIDQFVPACSSNYSDYSRGSGDIDMIVIHTMEGSYSGSISWFQNCSAQVSAHYMVRSSDGQITQMVQEEDVAWHAGDWDTNERSIGIEHEGYIADPGTWYTDAMYRESAALVRDICDRYGIPKDRAHIIGHAEVPGCSSGSGGGSGCHTDPGSGWDWDYYISLVNEMGSGSSSMGGTGLAEGTRSGSYSATVTATRYGETDTCSGSVSGSVNSGYLYLNGTCRLRNHPDASGDLAVTWTGTATGTSLAGRMVVDGRSKDFTGTVDTSGNVVTAHIAGSEDLGGDVGVLDYAVDISAAM